MPQLSGKEKKKRMQEKKAREQQRNRFGFGAPAGAEEDVTPGAASNANSESVASTPAFMKDISGALGRLNILGQRPDDASTLISTVDGDHRDNMTLTPTPKVVELATSFGGQAGAATGAVGVDG